MAQFICPHITQILSIICMKITEVIALQTRYSYTKGREYRRQ